MRTKRVKVRKAGTIKVTVPLSSKALTTLYSHGHRKLKLRVGFKPKSGHNSSAVKFALRR